MAGAGGRRPKPTALKIIQGNPGKRALPKNEPTAKVVRPSPPRHLDDLAKKEWRAIVKKLATSRILTELDVTGLELYCVTYSRWRFACEKLQNPDEMVVDTPNGFVTQATWLQIATRAHDQLRQMLIEYGLTPASRAKVQAVEDKNKTPKGFADL